MSNLPLNDLFPEGGRILLTGSGQEFIQRIGVEAAKQVIINVLIGENIRKQTEPPRPGPNPHKRPTRSPSQR